MVDSLGDRMKQIEGIPAISLMRKVPVIVRLDGKAFHTCTKPLIKPYDLRFVMAMDNATIELCKQVQGCKMAYIQSDEVSLLLTDFEDINTEAWFDYQVQKIVSVAASIMSVHFNKRIVVDQLRGDPVFDARAFNVPNADVANYFIWRQNDATRNSINGLGQKYFSHKELQGVSTNVLQEMLFAKHGINWNNIETDQKRGRCVVRQSYQEESVNPKTQEPITLTKSKWVSDLEIPVFTQDRNYIEKYLVPSL